MAKTTKYDESLLMKAVVSYAKEHRTKIKATELAQWADNNIEGLQGVRNYHFSRPAEIIDAKTGKSVKVERECAKKIKEINATRSTESAVHINPLLQASSIDAFHRLPRSEQDTWIEQTRKQVGELVVANKHLRGLSEARAAEIKEMEDRTAQVEKELSSMLDKQKRLTQAVSRCMEVVDETMRRNALAQIGFNGDQIDLDTFAESQTIQIKEAFSMTREIMNDLLTSEAAESVEGFEEFEDLDELISHINFDD